MKIKYLKKADISLYYHLYCTCKAEDNVCKKLESGHHGYCNMEKYRAYAVKQVSLYKILVNKPFKCKCYKNVTLEHTCEKWKLRLRIMLSIVQWMYCIQLLKRNSNYYINEYQRSY